MMERIRQGIINALWMVVAAALIGAAFNMIRPAGIPFVGDWSPHDVTELHAGDLEVIHVDDAFELLSQKKALFIDAREKRDFASGHIPDSVNITPEEVVQRQDDVRIMLKSGKTLIAYCHDMECPLGADLVKDLRSLGIGPVKVMPEGWVVWMDKGYPYE